MFLGCNQDAVVPSPLLANKPCKCYLKPESYTSPDVAYDH